MVKTVTSMDEDGEFGYGGRRGKMPTIRTEKQKGRIASALSRTKEVDWPVTMNDTRRKRIARKLWG